MVHEWQHLGIFCLQGMVYMICSLHYYSIQECMEWVRLKHLHNCIQLDSANSEENQFRWHSNLTNMADKLVTQQHQHNNQDHMTHMLMSCSVLQVDWLYQRGTVSVTDCPLGKSVLGGTQHTCC